MKALSKVRRPENLARAGYGMREEALNFLDSFCFVFLIKEKSGQNSKNQTASNLTFNVLTFKHPKEEYTFVKSVVFKGGTSLSKAFRLIDRFSEDVDIAVMSQPDWTGNKVNNYFPVNFEYINQLPEGRKVR